MAWKSLESNLFGTGEFMRLCRKMGWEPMLTANLGSGSPEEAAAWLEYCNAASGTRWSSLRREHGSPEPWGVRLWCLGNEMDGPWQIGHTTAENYADRARQTARMLKALDPGVECVACGSSGDGMSTYLEWDRMVLSVLGEDADYISLHRYAGNRENDTPRYLAEGRRIDRHIEGVDALCRAVAAEGKSRKRAYLCFDEWNVWYKDQRMDGGWTHAPHLIEEVYNLEDALVVAQFLMSFLRHADVVRVANLAQIVNVIAPILTEGDRMLLQSTYHAFGMVSRRREGVSLRCNLEGPVYRVEDLEGIPYVDAAAVLSGDRLSVFLVNRDPSKAREIRVETGSGAILGPFDGDLLTGPGPRAANSFEDPDVVTKRPLKEVVLKGGAATVELPALSFAALDLHLA